MVEVKSITVGQYRFAGIYINLPQYPIHFIISTHTILAQDNFSMDYFERLDRPVAVLLCRYTFGFAGILDSEIMSMNHIAKEKGVTIGMKAKDAVILCEEGKDQTI